MRKLSDAQILGAYKELRKLSMLKTALGRREKMLMALLGITAVPGSLVVAGPVKDNIDSLSPTNPLFKSDNSLEGYYYDKESSGKDALKEIMDGMKNQQDNFEDQRNAGDRG